MSLADPTRDEAMLRPPAPHGWPETLSAAASLLGLFLFWLVVLPFAALAFGTASAVDQLRRLWRPVERPAQAGTTNERLRRISARV